MNIDKKHINELIARYYAGQSDLAEEKELREFFESEAASGQEYDADRAVFRTVGARIEAPEELREAVDRIAAGHRRRQFRLSPFISRISAGAAVSLLAVSVSILYLGKPATGPDKLSPEEAQRQTIMALTLLADAVGKGYDAIEKSEATTIAVTEKAFETINQTR